MSDALIDILALAAPLSPIAADLAAVWAPVASRRAFAARDVLFAPADPVAALYALGAGRVKLTAVSSEGKELIIALHKRGDLIGELSPVHTGPHRTFAEAIEPGWAWRIPQEEVRSTLAADPAATLAFMRVHDARSRALEQRLAHFVFLEVPQRLAALLLELSAPVVEPEEAIPPVTLTHYELAGLIGSTRETTTQCLNRFREAGWVHLDKRHVRITNRTALEALVAGTQASEA